MLRKHAQFTPDPILEKKRKEKPTFELVEWWPTKKLPVNPVAKWETFKWEKQYNFLLI